MDLDINISDSISVIDSMKVGRVRYGDSLFTYGQVNIEYNGEFPAVYIYFSSIASEDLSISESLTLSSEGSLPVSDDALNVSEYVEIMLQSHILAGDDISISENFSKLESISIESFDGIHLSEYVEISNPLCFADIYDELNVSEQISTELENYLTASESLDITEYVKIENLLLINSYDGVSIEDQESIENSLCFANAHEDVSILDSATLELKMFAFAHDDVSVSEFIKKENILSVSEWDDVNISEQIETGVESIILAVDSVNVSENFKPSKVSFVHAFDDMEVSEFTNIGLVYNVHAEENIHVNGVITVESFRFSPQLSSNTGQISTKMSTLSGGGKVLSSYASNISVGTSVGAGKGTI